MYALMRALYTTDDCNVSRHIGMSQQMWRAGTLTYLSSLDSQPGDYLSQLRMCYYVALHTTSFFDETMDHTKFSLCDKSPCHFSTLYGRGGNLTLPDLTTYLLSRMHGQSSTPRELLMSCLRSAIYSMNAKDGCHLPSSL